MWDYPRILLIAALFIAAFYWLSRYFPSSGKGRPGFFFSFWLGSLSLIILAAIFATSPAVGHILLGHLLAFIPAIWLEGREWLRREQIRDLRYKRDELSRCIRLREREMAGTLFPDLSDEKLDAWREERRDIEQRLEALDPQGNYKAIPVLVSTIPSRGDELASGDPARSE